MKCSVCADDASLGGIACALLGAEVFMIVLCPICAVRIVGEPVLRRLKRQSGRAAWVQPALPL